MPRLPTPSAQKLDPASQAPSKSDASDPTALTPKAASATAEDTRADDVATEFGSGAHVDARLAVSVRAVAVVARHFERESLEAGLSLPQYRLLLFVRRGPQRAAELAARAAVRRPTLTALVDGLEKEGLLARRSVEGDRRGIRLELTRKGLETLDRAETQLSRFLESMIGDSDSERILDGLSELARAVERYYRNNAENG